MLVRFGKVNNRELIRPISFSLRVLCRAFLVTRNNFFPTITRPSIYIYTYSLYSINCRNKADHRERILEQSLERDPP